MYSYNDVTEDDVLNFLGDFPQIRQIGDLLIFWATGEKGAVSKTDLTIVRLESVSFSEDTKYIERVLDIKASPKPTSSDPKQAKRA